MTPVLTGWLLALLLGVRHASEPDHLVAVSTLLAEHSHTRRSALLGAFWGVGHTFSLLVVGGVLLVLRLRMPGHIADLFELVVALMLLMLGARSVRRALVAGRFGTSREHSHAGHSHLHSGPTHHLHLGAWTMARRPLLIGLVHGVAGSGALTALTLANMPSLGSGVIYMLLFGSGSVFGMALLTGLAGWPLRRIAERSHVQAALCGLAGITSLVLGMLWGWPLVVRLVGA